MYWIKLPSVLETLGFGCFWLSALIFDILSAFCLKVWGKLTGDIAAENWDMRGFLTFFQFFSLKNEAH